MSGATAHQQPVSQLLKGVNGQWSAMRLATLLICVGVLAAWLGCIVAGGQWIPLDWPTVTLLAGAQGAKALQGRFEFGPGGLTPPRGKPWDGEGL